MRKITLWIQDWITQMNLNALDAAFKTVQSFVGVYFSLCVSKHGSLPYIEVTYGEDNTRTIQWTYALSKRAMMDMGRAYSETMVFTVFSYIGPLYGPGCLSSDEHMSSRI